MTIVYLENLGFKKISQHSNDEDVQACLASGMNAHIAKPFNPADLLKLHPRTNVIFLPTSSWRAIAFVAT